MKPKQPLHGRATPRRRLAIRTPRAGGECRDESSAFEPDFFSFIQKQMKIILS